MPERIGADMYQEVLTFWFEEIEPKRWWASEPEFDDLLRERFLRLLEQAERGELYTWRREPKGRLAEIIVLDQFSRNIYRNTPAAFAQDPMALVKATGTAPKWNFHKYLIDRSGNVVAEYPSRVTPEDKRLVSDIEKALGKRK
jgi:uncharacterized protein (DUF924 family)